VSCYWARLKGFGGTVEDIISNDNLCDGYGVVTIASADKGFESDGCGGWSKDLSAVVNPGTPFDDGTFIVGTDLNPGRYHNSGGGSCYWARLKGFGGSTDDIIANDNVDSTTVVQISASDRGFETNDCGTWTAG
jgi:hypothetical protein